MRAILLFVSLLFFIPTRAEEFLLTGTIGKHPVILNIMVDGNDAEGNYCYHSSAIDIPLKGESAQDGMLLYVIRNSAKTGYDDTAEVFKITHTAGQGWVGKWTNRKGKVLDIVLRPANVTAIKHPYAHLPVVKKYFSSNKYNYLRSASLPIIADTGLTTNGKYKLKYYHLKNSPIFMFEIVSGLDNVIAAKVNDLLRNNFIDNASEFCSCLGADTPDYQYDIDNVYLTDNILSINVMVEFYCLQAAHPDGGNVPLTIDLKTGNQLVLEDVLYLSGPAPSPNTVKWGHYREKIYGPKLLALLKKLYSKQLEANEECDYNSSDPWAFAEFYITQNGLYLSPSFPHVAAPCRNPEWAYIPFDLLKKYKHPAKHIVWP